MFKEKLEKVIEDIQSKNKEFTKFPSLLEVCEPGESKFIPKRVGESGYLLLCPFKIKQKISQIIIPGASDKPTTTDYFGVNPFLMVVMESSSSYYIPGDVVVIDPRDFKSIMDNSIIVRSSVAHLLPDNLIQGKDGYITELAKNYEIIKTLADA